MVFHFMKLFYSGRLVHDIERHFLQCFWWNDDVDRGTWRRSSYIISTQLFGVRFHRGRYPQNLHNNIIYYVKKLEAPDG